MPDVGRDLSVPRVVVAGVASGVGKTTIASAIMAALTRRGLRVQPFKVGPDYIDPSYHALATGRPSRNLDSWILTPEVVTELFSRAARKADIAVIEGVMGLFDGHSGGGDAGSTAEIAKLLKSPVVLIIDAGRIARSAGALALGYAKFDPELELRGFIVNNIGSSRHFEWVREAIEAATSLPVLGCLPKNAQFELPERHLGLVPTAEQTEAQIISHLGQKLAETIDVEHLIGIARSARPVTMGDAVLLRFSTNGAAQLANIAVARDEAFSFYYQDNLDLLETHGARLLFFSPMHDKSLPRDTHGVYIGGGFPEMYSHALSANSAMRASIREAAARGMPVYAECGGLMYLSEGITDFDGNCHPMVGLVPGWSVMENRLVRLGYVEFEALSDNVLCSKGTRLRGHEFHWSRIEGECPAPAWAVSHPHQGVEGYVGANILASYMHIHFGTDSSLARRFVRFCMDWARRL